MDDKEVLSSDQLRRRRRAEEVMEWKKGDEITAFHKIWGYRYGRRFDNGYYPSEWDNKALSTAKRSEILDGLDLIGFIDHALEYLHRRGAAVTMQNAMNKFNEIRIFMDKKEFTPYPDVDKTKAYIQDLRGDDETDGSTGDPDQGQHPGPTGDQGPDEHL